MHSEQWPPYSPGRSAPEYFRPENPSADLSGPGWNDLDATLLSPPQDFRQFPQQHPDQRYGHDQQYRDDQRYHQPVYTEAAIAVTPRYFPLAVILELVRPVLIIDGLPVRMSWRNPAVVPVSPGRHHVQVYTPYLIPRRMGRADLVVDTQPGQTVELEYRSPLIVFLRGAIGPGPQRYPGMAAFIILTIISVVLGLCTAASAFRGFGEAAARQTAAPVAGEPAGGRPPIPALPPLPTDGPGLPTGEPGLPTGEPGRTGATGAAGRPVLRPGAEVRRVTGATFAAGDRTGARAFAGWPFAFRTPQGWDCRPQSDDRVPDAKLYGCGRDRTTGDGLVVVMLRPCTAPCGDAQMNRMHTFWFSPGDTIRQAGATTRFVENAEGATTGGYELYLSHLFAAGDRAGTPDWQVAVVGVAKSKAGRTEAQKVLNDILSQTS